VPVVPRRKWVALCIAPNGPASLHALLRAAMAWVTQALQRAGPEGRQVAPVWLYVVHHVSGLQDSALEAEPAQRLLLQVQPADRPPPGACVPLAVLTS